MVVFTLPSHDLVFKVIRDRFGPPKNTTRTEVMEKYQWVFEHDRVGRLVDAQEYKAAAAAQGALHAGAAQELLTECGSVCRLDGDDLIVGHCYIERRLRPLDLFLRDADSVAAERALLDYGDALRELAGIDVFPGDLLLKNFGVTSQGKVVFYDYDEVTSLRECNFRELPTATTDEDEFSAEPWFFVGRTTSSPSNGCHSWASRRSCSIPSRPGTANYWARIGGASCRWADAFLRPMEDCGAAAIRATVAVPQPGDLPCQTRTTVASCSLRVPGERRCRRISASRRRRRPFLPRTTWLLRTLYLSLDPYMRGMMNERAARVYALHRDRRSHAGRHRQPRHCDGKPALPGRRPGARQRRLAGIVLEQRQGPSPAR
jgi:hypothetical protein